MKSGEFMKLTDIRALSRGSVQVTVEVDFRMLNQNAF